MPIKAQLPSFLTFKNEQLLYLIDFGISTRFIDDDGKLLSQKILKNIRCSPQYSGLNQLNGMCKLFFFLIMLEQPSAEKTT